MSGLLIRSFTTWTTAVEPLIRDFCTFWSLRSEVRALSERSFQIGRLTLVSASISQFFGALFPLAKWLSFIAVFSTTAFFEASEPVEGAFSPFFSSFASYVSDFVGSLVPEMGSAFVDSEPPFFSACVWFDPAERSSFQSLKRLRLSQALVNALWQLRLLIAMVRPF